ncbi:MAG: hypothetical protein WAR79_14440 [Melioribacteraceae bacterium]
MGLYRHRQVFNNNSYQYVLEVDFQLDSFREYIKLTEKTVENDIKEKIKAYDRFLKEASDAEIEYLHDFEEHEIKIHTRKLYYHSLFISLYSFLERKMYQLCRLAEEHQTLKIKDISGDGIFKYYKYFKKVLGINLDGLNAEWTEITKYNKLRNRLVHSQTNTIENGDNNKELIRTLQSINNLVVIDKGDSLEFEITDKELLMTFCSIINKFLNDVYLEKA